MDDFAQQPLVSVQDEDEPGFSVVPCPAPESLAAERTENPEASQEVSPAADGTFLFGAEPSATLARLQETVTAGFADLLTELHDKLAYDQFKEQQIARLHEELQAYKSDLISKPARQLLQGLIRLHDDLGKMAASLRQKPAEELTPERFFQQFADFQDDIELLLGQHGVERFGVDGEAFDPRRQTALRTVPTSDPAQVGRIAERLRPGFEQGEALLQKERVAVYAASNDINDQAQGGQS